MPRLKSRAFILEATDYRETSKLLQIFCENEGRIALIARGMRGPRSQKAALADVFNLVQVTYTLKDHATLGLLSGIEAETTFAGIRTKLDNYALASFWFEIVKVASQARMSSAEVFLLTQSFLSSLDKDPPGLATYWHLLRLIELLGFGMQFLKCGSCHTDRISCYFDSSLGSVLCESCSRQIRQAVRLPTELIEILAAMPTQPPSGNSMAWNRYCRPFLHMINQFLTIHLDHRLRTFSFLEETLATGPTSSN